jgi:hypothetical protein
MIQKNHVEVWIFQCEMDYKQLKMTKNDILKNKSIFFVLGEFQCILFLNSLFDVGLFFKYYIDITLAYFLSSHFSLYLCDKHNVKFIMSPF